MESLKKSVINLSALFAVTFMCGVTFAFIVALNIWRLTLNADFIWLGYTVLYTVPSTLFFYFSFGFFDRLWFQIGLLKKRVEKETKNR
jgi:hypothetical protein